MNRLVQSYRVIQEIGWWTFLKRVGVQINEDNVFTWAAALAYSWLFALFPFVIFLITLLPLLPDRFRDGAQEFLQTSVSNSLAGDSAKVVNDQIQKFLDEPAAGLLSVGLILAVWAASGGIAATMSSMDQAYDVVCRRPFWRQRLVAIGLTVFMAVMIFGVMILLPVGTQIIQWLAEHGRLAVVGRIAIDATRYLVSLGMLVVVVGTLYHYGPSLRRKYQVVSVGAVFCVIVWVLIGLGFRLYLVNFGGASSYSKTFGAVGGIAIMLLIFYVDAAVLLIGAEINSEIDFARLGIHTSNTSQKHATRVMSEEDRKLADELIRCRGPAATGRTS